MKKMIILSILLMLLIMPLSIMYVRSEDSTLLASNPDASAGAVPVLSTAQTNVAKIGQEFSMAIGQQYTVDSTLSITLVNIYSSQDPTLSDTASAAATSAGAAPYYTAQLIITRLSADSAIPPEESKIELRLGEPTTAFKPYQVSLVAIDSKTATLRVDDLSAIQTEPPSITPAPTITPTPTITPVIDPVVYKASFDTEFKFTEGTYAMVGNKLWVSFINVFDGSKSASPIQQPSTVTLSVNGYNADATDAVAITDQTLEKLTLQVGQKYTLKSGYVVELISVTDNSGVIKFSVAPSPQKIIYANLGEQFTARTGMIYVIRPNTMITFVKISGETSTEPAISTQASKQVIIDVGSYLADAPTTRYYLNPGDSIVNGNYKIQLISVNQNQAVDTAMPQYQAVMLVTENTPVIVEKYDTLGTEFSVKAYEIHIVDQRLSLGIVHVDFGPSAGTAALKSLAFEASLINTGYPNSMPFQMNLGDAPIKYDIYTISLLKGSGDTAVLKVTLDGATTPKYVAIGQEFTGEKDSLFNIANLFKLRIVSIVSDATENPVGAGVYFEVIPNIDSTDAAPKPYFISTHSTVNAYGYEIALLSSTSTEATMIVRAITQPTPIPPIPPTLSTTLNGVIGEKIQVPLGTIVNYAKDELSVTYNDLVPCASAFCPMGDFTIKYDPKVSTTQHMIIKQAGRYDARVAWYDTAGYSNITVIIDYKDSTKKSKEIDLGQFRGASNYPNKVVDLGNLVAGDEVTLTIQTNWWAKWYNKAFSTNPTYFHISYVDGKGYVIECDDGIKYDGGYNDALVYIENAASPTAVPSTSATAAAGSVSPTISNNYVNDRKVRLGTHQSFMFSSYVLTVIDVNEKYATIVVDHVSTIDANTETYVQPSTTLVCKPGCRAVGTVCVCPSVEIAPSTNGVTINTALEDKTADSAKILPGSNKISIQSAAENYDLTAAPDSITIKQSGHVLHISTDESTLETYITDADVMARTRMIIITQKQALLIQGAQKTSEVKILPKAADQIAKTKISTYNDDELTEQNGKAVYVFSADQKYKILGFIPAKSEVSAVVDAADGGVKTSQPWYSIISTKG